MSTLTTTLSLDDLEDLVEDISGVTVFSASATEIVLELTYSEDPQADFLVVRGTGLSLAGDTLTAGTITGFEFFDGSTSLLLASGLAITAEQVNTLLGNPESFGSYLEHLAGDDHGHGGADGEEHIGGDDSDDLESGEGDDYLSGGGGDDDLDGGGGDDYIDGGTGDDTVHYEDARKVMVNLAAGTAKGDGNDILVEVENVVGSNGNDQIIGDAGDNDLEGGRGNDKIVAGEGNNTVTGGDGNDNLAAGGGDDTIFGDRGNDKIVAGNGANIIEGGDGNDNIAAGSGDDWVAAGSGNDKVVSGDGSDEVFGDAGNDVLMTGSGDDVIDGGSGKDNIKAGDGNDVIDGGSGDDLMDGGAGDDTYYVDSLKDKIIEKAGGGEDTVVADMSYTLAKLTQIENLVLDESAHPLDIDATGNAGNNELTGNSGDNLLNGKAGADILTGGLGDDGFVFDNLAIGGADTVMDFTSGDDLLLFSGSVFSAFAGGVSAGNVVNGGAALDANDFLVFDAGSGALYYDADGNGGGAAVHVATLEGVGSLTADDFGIA